MIILNVKMGSTRKEAVTFCFKVVQYTKFIWETEEDYKPSKKMTGLRAENRTLEPQKTNQVS